MRAHILKTPLAWWLDMLTLAALLIIVIFANDDTKGKLGAVVVFGFYADHSVEGLHNVFGDHET